MKIIEIRKTNIGEVAYVFSSGKIYKILVEDLTRETIAYQEAALEEVEEVERPPARRNLRREVTENIFEEKEERPVFQKPAGKIPMEERPPAEEVPSDPKEQEMVIIDDELVVRKKTPTPKRPNGSIIPNHLRGLFIPADSPGAAVETRRV